MAHSAATAAAVGFAPTPPAIPALLAPVADQASQLRAEIASRGRRDDGPVPVRSGKVRLRLLTNFQDDEDNCYRLVGDVFDRGDASARDLVRRRVAVPALTP